MNHAWPWVILFHLASRGAGGCLVTHSLSAQRMSFWQGYRCVVQVQTSSLLGDGRWKTFQIILAEMRSVLMKDVCDSLSGALITSFGAGLVHQRLFLPVKR